VHATRASSSCSSDFPCSDIQNLGLLCNVDLFPVPQLDSTSEPSSLPHPLHQLSPVVVHPSPSASVCHQQSSMLPSISTDQLPGQSKLFASGPLTSTQFDYSLVTEDLKHTRALSGATFVQPVFIDYQGKRALVFPFAVRLSIPAKSLLSQCYMHIGSCREGRGRLLPSLSRFRSLFTHCGSSRCPGPGRVQWRSIPHILNKRIPGSAAIYGFVKGNSNQTKNIFINCLAATLQIWRTTQYSRDGTQAQEKVRKKRYPFLHRQR